MYSHCMTEANRGGQPHVFSHDRIVEKIFLWAVPRWVLPNHFTLARIVLTPVVFFLILYEEYQVGIPLFLLTAFTDVIDGSLARTRNQITEWGKMFDPVADKLLIGSLVIILAFKYLSFWLVIAILGLEIAFIVAGFLQWRRFHKIRGANLWGKIKMLSQCIAVFLVLIALVFEMPLFLAAAQWIFGLAIGFAIVSLFSHGI